MLWRALLRGTAEGLITLAAQTSGANVTSSKDTPVQSGSMPWIVVYADDKKFGTGPRQYKTEGMVTITVRAEMPSRHIVVGGLDVDVGDKDAEALRDQLCELVETTLLGSKGFPVTLSCTNGSAIATPAMGSPQLFPGFLVYGQPISDREMVAIAAVNTDGSVSLSAPFLGPSGSYRFTIGSFSDLFEGIDKVETFTQEAGYENANHVMGATIEIVGHVTESFQPSFADNLNGITLYIDSQNIFDPNGTYTGEPFGGSPAPRTSGPDGRTEIAASIDLTS